MIHTSSQDGGTVGVGCGANERSWVFSHMRCLISDMSVKCSGLTIRRTVQGVVVLQTAESLNTEWLFPLLTWIGCEVVLSKDHLGEGHTSE